MMHIHAIHAGKKYKGTECACGKFLCGRQNPEEPTVRCNRKHGHTGKCSSSAGVKWEQGVVRAPPI